MYNLVLEDWPELLLVLWREQHPEGHGETALVSPLVAACGADKFLGESVGSIELHCRYTLLRVLSWQCSQLRSRCANLLSLR